MSKARKKHTAGFTLDCMATSSRMREYNGLRDYNLAGFFASRDRRKMLVKQRLISKEGAIVESSSRNQLNAHFPPIRQRKDPFSADSRPRKSKSAKSHFQPVSKEKLYDLIAKMRNGPSRTEQQVTPN